MGTNTNADPTVMNNVGEKDKLGLEIEQAQKDSINRELEQFNKQLVANEDSRENWNKQWAIDNELYQVILNSPNKIPEKIEFEYEKNPRYWELRKAQLEFKYRWDCIKSKSQSEYFDKAKESIMKEIESATNKLKELEGSDVDGTRTVPQ